jgi:hypothetical protein
MIDLPRSHSYPVHNPRRPQGKASAKADLLPNCALTSELRHRAVIAIDYVRFDHGMLIDHVPWSRVGPEVRPAFCVSGLDGGNIRNDRLRRAARISRLRHRPANDEVIRPGGNGGGGRLSCGRRLQGLAAIIGG